MRPFVATLWLLSISVVAFCLVEYGSPPHGSQTSAKYPVATLTPQRFSEYLREEMDQDTLEVAARSVHDTRASHPVLTAGLVARYGSGARRGQPIGPDIEAWFNADYFKGRPRIVAQWARSHAALARAWVECAASNKHYVDLWAAAHSKVVADWERTHRAAQRPNASDLAVPFFENFSDEFPGRFPSLVATRGPDGKRAISVVPVDQGRDIRTIFFEMWLQDHSGTVLADLPDERAGLAATTSS